MLNTPLALGTVDDIGQRCHTPALANFTETG